MWFNDKQALLYVMYKIFNLVEGVGWNFDPMGKIIIVIEWYKFNFSRFQCKIFDTAVQCRVQKPGYLQLTWRQLLYSVLARPISYIFMDTVHMVHK